MLVTISTSLVWQQVMLILRKALPYQIVCFFFNIVQTAFDPPPLFLNIYVADFSKGLLKKCVNACRDKCVKIVRKSLGKNVQFTKTLPEAQRTQGIESLP